MTEMQDSIKQATFDRASFIVGLSASLVALYPFKDSAINMNIRLLIWDITLYDVALIFLGLLLLSAYLYGINTIRYSISRVLEWKWTRHIETSALFFYTAAFLVPLVILFILWPVSFLLSYIPTNSALLTIITSTTAGFVSGAILIYVSYQTIESKKDLLIEEMNNMQQSLKIQTDNAYRAGDIRFSALSLYQNFMSALKSKLVAQIGIRAQSLPDFRAVKVASDIGLIDQGDIPAINDLRGMRNQIAHNVNGVHLNKDSFMEINQRMIKIINRILSKKI